jgi:hypothetical protein
MPAKAGIQVSFLSTRKNWIPAYAGMTEKKPTRSEMTCYID